jgi:hypothetical protein
MDFVRARRGLLGRPLCRPASGGSSPTQRAPGGALPLFVVGWSRAVFHGAGRLSPVAADRSRRALALARARHEEPHAAAHAATDRALIPRLVRCCPTDRSASCASLAVGLDSTGGSLADGRRRKADGDWEEEGRFGCGPAATPHARARIESSVRRHAGGQARSRQVRAGWWSLRHISGAADHRVRPRRWLRGSHLSGRLFAGRVAAAVAKRRARRYARGRRDMVTRPC